MGSKFLKGNYKTKAGTLKKKNKSAQEIKNIFESKATQKLGGSIAFVMKSDKFLWGIDEKA